MKKFLLFSVLFFSSLNFFLPLNLTAQTLVNKKFEFETGKPHALINFVCGGRDSVGNIIIASNTVSNLYGETIHITKSDPDGNLLFEADENLDSTQDYLFVTDMVLAGTDIYLTGTGIARDSSYSYFLTAKFDSALNNVWGQYYSGPYGGYNAATTVYFEPDSGALFVSGSEQTDSNDFEYTLIKYDTAAGDVMFIAHYDSVGLYDLSTGMVRWNNHLAVGALSGKDTTWQLVAAVFNIHSGELEEVLRMANDYGTLNRTVDIAKNANGEVYLLGVMDSAGFVKMRLVKTTEYLYKVWERDWLVPGSVATIPKAMAVDPQYGYVTITGTAQMLTGGTQLFAVAYLDSEQQWYRTIGAPNPAQNAAGNDISLDANDNVFITGSVSNGTDLDFMTVSYTWDGNLRWYKSYKHCDGCSDEGKFVLAIGDECIVAGTSVGAGDTSYVTVGYKEMELSKELEIDTIHDKPLFIKNQIIVKFNRNAVIDSVVDNPEINFGNLNTFLHSWAVDSITRNLPYDFYGVKLARVFYRLKTTDTISISRLGERIPIPDFWSTFVLMYDPLITEVPLSERQLCNDLNKLFPFVETAELDWTASLASNIPDDDLYRFQYSIDSAQVHPYASARLDINASEAWNYTTGKQHIKVGIFDTGLLLTHADFYTSFNDSSLIFSNSVAKGGRDYIYKTPLGTGRPSDYGNGHGTQMGGIIGAVRNNSRGVAGLAGGDSATSEGVSLYGFRIFTDVLCATCNVIAPVHNFVDGLIEVTTQTPDSSYGYGMQILNNSYHLISQLSVDSGYLIDSNWSLIIDAFHYANRNKVIMPAAAGNENYDFIDAPASFDDDWMLAVGGTGHNGGFESSDQYDHWAFNWGYGLDIAAPSDEDLVYTTCLDSLGSYLGSYCTSNGTSAATAHVSGVAALLLSYLNDSASTYQNLAPEDVEYIIQRSAFNVDTPGYDLLTGFGRLNAGGALSIVDTSKRKLYHFDSDSLTHTTTAIIGAGSYPLQLTEKARNLSGTLFDHKFYRADIYKITCNLSLSLSASDTLVAYWPRPSSSFTYDYSGTTSLVPHEKINIESINHSNAVVSGYVYHLYDTSAHQWAGWLPMDTAQAITANFAISGLTGDTIYAPWDSILNTATVFESENIRLKLYPNPVNDYGIIEITVNGPENISLRLYNIEGKEARDIFTGALNNESRRFILSTSSLRNGMYFVLLETKNQNKFLKLVKF